MNDIKVGAVVCALMIAVSAGLTSCTYSNDGVHAESVPAAADTSAQLSAEQSSERSAEGSADSSRIQIVMNDTSPTYTYTHEDTSSDTSADTEADTASQSVPVSGSSAEPAVPVSVPDTAPADTSDAPSETAAPTETAAQPEHTAPETPAPTYTSPVVTLASSQPSEGYDRSFFAGDLFIGDSISTGYSLYGYLDPVNVYAKVGLNPSTVLTKKVSTPYGEIGVSDMVSFTKPERAYVMLGSNGIQWLSVNKMVECTNTLVSLISETSPDTEVVIISVPPVTPAYDSTVADVNVMAKIDEYNRSLAEYCEENGLLFCDIAEELKDSSGYFNSSYAEKDGMHFKPAAYKIVLSRIQSDVEQSETAAAAETEVPDDISDIEDDIFEDIIGDGDETETDMSEVTTVPEEEDTSAETVTTVPDEVVIPSETSIVTEPAAETVTAAPEKTAVPSETTVTAAPAQTTVKASETAKKTVKTKKVKKKVTTAQTAKSTDTQTAKSKTAGTTAKTTQVTKKTAQTSGKTAKVTESDKKKTTQKSTDTSKKTDNKKTAKKTSTASKSTKKTADTSKTAKSDKSSSKDGKK